MHFAIQMDQVISRTLVEVTPQTFQKIGNTPVLPWTTFKNLKTEVWLDQTNVKRARMVDKCSTVNR